LKAEIVLAAGESNAEFIDATAIGTRFFGDSITANIFLLGLAFQRGCIPVSLESLTRAIELNGVSVETSKRIFALGRAAAENPDILRVAENKIEPVGVETPQDVVNRRAIFLTDYENAAYAERYCQAVARAEDAETRSTPGETGFSAAVAGGLFKLMAYKDEYEVARLFTATDFRAAVDRQFTGPYRIKYHLAPPLLSRRDEATGRPRKSAFGPWVFNVFRVLASLKGLRGTPFDLFGYQKDRRIERQLIRDYEDLIKVVAAKLSPTTHTAAVALAQLPHDVRGFGPVKRDSVEAFYRRRDELLAQLNNPPERRDAA
jgi:indolepyruvate ferredoxin oxidoreductase